MIQVLKKSKEEAEKEGIKILTRMGLEAKINQYPCNLSGGEQQRASIARTLAINPKIIFMDEPTRGVDVGAKQEIYKLLAELAEAGIAIVIVSSEMEELLGMSDRILILHEGVSAGEISKGEFSQEIVMQYSSGL